MDSRKLTSSGTKFKVKITKESEDIQEAEVAGNVYQYNVFRKRAFSYEADSMYHGLPRGDDGFEDVPGESAVVGDGDLAGALIRPNTPLRKSRVPRTFNPSTFDSVYDKFAAVNSPTYNWMRYETNQYHESQRSAFSYESDTAYDIPSEDYYDEFEDVGGTTATAVVGDGDLAGALIRPNSPLRKSRSSSTDDNSFARKSSRDKFSCLNLGRLDSKYYENLYSPILSEKDGSHGSMSPTWSDISVQTIRSNNSEYDYMRPSTSNGIDDTTRKTYYHYPQDSDSDE